MRIIITVVLIVNAALSLAQTPASTTANAPVATIADSLFFNLKYEDAVRSYEDFIAKNPNAPLSSFARMAFSQHYTRHYDEALKSYDIVISKKPGPAMKANLYSRMSMTWSVKKNKLKSLEFLDSAVANGYANSYEMDHSPDYAMIREEPKFKELYKKAYAASFPCSVRPESRLFDFWVGEWDVFLNAYPHQQVGTSSIQNVSGECIILENWQSQNNSFTGKSQNWFDPATKKWTQLWIGSGGGFQYFRDGEYKNGAMRFTFTQPDTKGYPQPGNFIFYNMGPDMVRQYNEVSTDSGKTFTPVYDFIYKRRNAVNDEQKIRAINRKYVDAWLNYDENGVLSLFSNDASISPGGMKTYKGIKEIRNFWFPKDGSTTSIVSFSNEIQDISFDGDYAYSSQKDHLYWTYKNKTTEMKKEQWGFATTVYKKQPNGDWKIIHQMWKDYKVEDK
jgi:uncharacterized protein (TIGR02246 family)